MKAVLFFLVFLSIPVFAVQIDQRWPTMSLGEYVAGECVAIPGVSKSIDDFIGIADKDGWVIYRAF